MNLLHRKGDPSDTGSGDGSRALPDLPGPLAAAAVGVLSAVLAMVLVWLGERGCDAVRGAPSCGSAGAVLLAVTAALVLAAGFALLRLLRSPDAALTNLLGFALFAIALMTALLDYVFSASMWVVLPVLGAVCYAAGAAISAALAKVGGS